MPRMMASARPPSQPSGANDGARAAPAESGDGRDWPASLSQGVPVLLGVLMCAALGCHRPVAPAVRPDVRVHRCTGPGEVCDDRIGSQSSSLRKTKVLDRVPPSLPHRGAPPREAISFDPHLTMAEPPRCPAEMAVLPPHACIDRWEASLVELLPGGQERAWSPYREVTNRTKARLRAVSIPGVPPQGYISGVHAARACAEAGKRLCGADEWEAACRGANRTRFPYGEERRQGACNDDKRRRHPVIEVTRKLGLPEEDTWKANMHHPLINQLADTVDLTGERSECTNELGVFDMVGNLHEWVDDASGTFRGGYYMDTSINGDGCSYATKAHGMGYQDYSTGFRCCMDADPVE